MTIQELNEQIAYVRKEAEQAVDTLRKRYAIANNEYKIGDIISDQFVTIRIEDLKYSRNAVPCMVYYGTRINKDGSDNKKGDKEHIYQSNVKK